jgi:hypothetical protein
MPNRSGFWLVVPLVEMLVGTIELDRNAGTAFTLVVQEKEATQTNRNGSR